MRREKKNTVQPMQHPTRKGRSSLKSMGHFSAEQMNFLAFVKEDYRMSNYLKKAYDWFEEHQLFLLFSLHSLS